MKSYSFYFNASDWLSSPAVKLMSKAERGAYIDLLAIAWQSNSPGTLPASEDKVRRLAELSMAEWAESGEALLEQFPLSECGTYRLNKRLMLEANKEEAKSQKASASAKMRWQSDGNANASKKNANASKKACERNTQEQVQEQVSSNDDSAKKSSSAQALKADKSALSHDLQARLAALTDTSGEINWRESILSKPDYFAKTARKLVAADVDLEHYRRAALIVAEAADLSRDIKGWESWVSIYFTNQLQRGPLLTVAAATLDLSQPTPKHLMPTPGTDCTGRHIVLPNKGDETMNRMAAASYASHYPNAIIHHTR